MARLTIEQGDREMLFRVPQVDDLWELWDSLPVTPDSTVTGAKLDQLRKKAEAAAKKKKKTKAELDADRETSKKLARFYNALLCRVAIAPRLVLEPVAEHPEGEECVIELDVSWRQEAAERLLKAAGWGEG